MIIPFPLQNIFIIPLNFQLKEKKIIKALQEVQ